MGFIARLFNRSKNKLPPFDFARNRYPAHRKWPPDFSTLTEQQQFRFERKFKRRLMDKAVRPEWNKRVKIFTNTLISVIVVYAVLFYDFASDPMNPRPGEQPFKELRAWMWRKLGGFYTHTEEGHRGETRALHDQERERERVGGEAK